MKWENEFKDKPDNKTKQKVGSSFSFIYQCTFFCSTYQFEFNILFWYSLCINSISDKLLVISWKFLITFHFFLQNFNITSLPTELPFCLFINKDFRKEMLFLSLIYTLTLTTIYLFKYKIKRCSVDCDLSSNLTIFFF